MEADLKRAEKLASDLLTTYEVYNPPVPLRDILKKENIKVMEAELPEHRYPDLHSFFIPYDGKKIIYVDRNDTKEQQTFTIAYELGHYLLGHISKEYEREYGQLLKSTKTEKISHWMDQEANYFAANLLMPKKMLFHLLDESLTMMSNSELAAIFGVSLPAMLARRETLGF